MKNFGKILGYNMLIMLVYTAGIHIVCGGGKNEGGMVILIIMIFPVALHALVNFIISMVKFFYNKDSGQGGSYLLSTFLVGIIGFGACWGSASF